MKKIILIAFALLSFNAFSEEFNFAEFESELAELESSSSLEDANALVDKISTLQSANDKSLETSFSTQEIYEIIPLPELEGDIQKEMPKETNAPQKRVRGH